MATHSGVLAWRIPRTEGPGGLQSWGGRVRHNRVTNTHFFTILPGTENPPSGYYRADSCT